MTPASTPTRLSADNANAIPLPGEGAHGDAIWSVAFGNPPLDNHLRTDGQVDGITMIAVGAIVPQSINRNLALFACPRWGCTVDDGRWDIEIECIVALEAPYGVEGKHKDIEHVGKIREGVQMRVQPGAGKPVISRNRLPQSLLRPVGEEALAGAYPAWRRTGVQSGDLAGVLRKKIVIMYRVDVFDDG